MRKDIAILAIHGFGGDVSEISPLCDIMRKKEYCVVSPTLAGHGATKVELSQTKFTDWIESAIESYVQLEAKYEKVVVIGFSMGGLIAVNLYELYPFDYFITVNTPIYFWNIKAAVHNLSSDFSTTAHKYIDESRNKSLGSMTEFLKILNLSKQKFNKVDCDTLIIQALDDDTVKPKSANYIYNHVKGNKEQYFCDTGGHIVLKSENVDDIAYRIDSFIRGEDIEDKGQ